jgi:hypothetical protein
MKYHYKYGYGKLFLFEKIKIIIVSAIKVKIEIIIEYFFNYVLTQGNYKIRTGKGKTKQISGQDKNSKKICVI